jgi:thioredoxin:protein disulfide reductase
MNPFRFALAALLAASALSARAGVDPSELLPVEQAFALTATATARDRIEFRWLVADGYYLYRHRIAVQPVDAGFKFNPLELPAGEKKNDEFFGAVETYRGELVATLTGAAATGVEQIEFNVRYQGCADVGVCYPPHQQRISVALPEASAADDTASAASVLPPAPGAALSSAPLITGSPNPLQQALSGGGTPAVATVEALPLDDHQAFGFEAIAVSPTELLLRFTPAPGYYLYRDRSSFRLLGSDRVGLGTPRWPAGDAHEDEHFGKVTVYFTQVEVPVPLQRIRAAAENITLEATFQGCQTDGICYPPMVRSVEIALAEAPASALVANLDPPQPAPAGETSTAPQGEDSRLAAALAGPDRLLTLLTFFGFGLLLAFTPCVFPMIPILSGIIAGAGVLSTRRAFVLSLVYVLATAVVFTVAGVIAGLAGKNLQAAFQQPWILTAFALLFVALALSMFGFYELQLPSRLQTRLSEFSNRQSGGSLLGVAIMGVLSALIVGPCVAPPLAAAVLYIAQTRDPILGGAALFALALGMGAPLVVFGTASGRWLPRAGAWMDAIKAVFGVLFLALAIWMLERFLEPFWILLMSGVLLIGSGVRLGALERLPEHASGWRSLWKSLGLVLLLLGALELVGALAGGRDPLQPLRGVFNAGAAQAGTHLPFRAIKSAADVDAAVAQANAAGQPVLLDFYADWCVACKEMEKYTFTEPAVHDALAGVVLLKADVTANDETDQALLQRYGLIGPPATLFFGRDGQERRAARLIGFESAEAFVARVREATQAP